MNSAIDSELEKEKLFGDQHKESCCEKHLTRPAACGRRHGTMFLQAAVVVLGLLLVISLTLQRGSTCVRVRDEADTELAAAVSAIHMIRTRFTSGIKLFPNATMVRIGASSRLDYVGSPSKEKDALWDELILGDAELPINDKEVMWFNNEIDKEPNDKRFSIVLAVDHNLHCVNLLRQYMDRDTHYTNLLHPQTRIHVDHCIDNLRETLMCSIDLTPIPGRWVEEVGRTMPDFQRYHTCRDWEGFMQWKIDRKGRL